MTRAQHVLDVHSEHVLKWLALNPAMAIDGAESRCQSHAVTFTEDAAMFNAIAYSSVYLGRGCVLVCKPG